MTSKRVAFTLIGGAAWTGGRNYLVNLISAVASYESHRIRPVIFCGDDTADGDVRAFLGMSGVEVVRSPVFDGGRSAARLVRSLVWGLDREALAVFRAHGIDAVFEPAVFYGWRFPIPAIAWLPDFQHKRLREQFGFGAYWRRELGFRAQIASGRIVMLSSEDARRDCARFYPRSGVRTAVVRFACVVDPALVDDEPETVLGEYGLPRQFFYLPNQFWKHKNHGVVVDALNIVRRKGLDIVVVATGNPLDPRHPEYFEALGRRIDALGMKQHFRVLGLVPRRHVISLLRTCTALINPSLFEGWSSSVEEARALGVPMILSDIGVHREQMGDDAVYFEPMNAEELAERIRVVTVKQSALVGHRSVVKGSEANIARFAGDFANTVNWAIDSRNHE